MVNAHFQIAFESVHSPIMTAENNGVTVLFTMHYQVQSQST